MIQVYEFLKILKLTWEGRYIIEIYLFLFYFFGVGGKWPSGSPGKWLPLSIDIHTMKGKCVVSFLGGNYWGEFGKEWGGKMATGHLKGRNAKARTLIYANFLGGCGTYYIYNLSQPIKQQRVLLHGSMLNGKLIGNTAILAHMDAAIVLPLSNRFNIHSFIVVEFYFHSIK